MKLLRLGALAPLLAAQLTYACGPDSYIGALCVTAADFCPNGTMLANGQELAISSNNALFSLIGTRFGGNGNTTFKLPDMRGRTPVGTGIPTGGSYQVSLGQARGSESAMLQGSQLPGHTHPFVATTSPQNVTIPATQGSNTTLSGSVGVVPEQGNTGNDFTPVAGNTYQLSGASVTGAQSMVGPYSTTSLPATPAHVSGVKVDASSMTPNIPEKTVTITTVTGGTVGSNNPNSQVAVPTIPPQLGLTWCITVTGTYPSRP